jgi:predicted nucleic acid-binding protein
MAPDPSPVTLLDACAVVNLFATRRMRDILAAAHGRCAIADTVVREAQFVFRGGSGPDAREREPVDLHPLISGGTLEVVVTEDEETLITFIDLAQQIGEGEAMTGALAIHRQCAVVTDDKKATRILTAHGVSILSTLAIVKQWVEHDAIDSTTLGAVLKDLRERGHYEPPRAHPLRGWWDGALPPR